MLQLLLPALIPSWRFFDRIGPAPCIEFAVGVTPEDAGGDWQELRPRPARVSAGAMVVRLFWNRRWNESLYLVSCAERLLDDPSPERATELWTRCADIVHAEHRRGTAADRGFLRVRVVETMRENGRVVRHVVFVSEAHRFVDVDEARAT